RLMIYSTVSWYLCLLLFVSQRTETFCMLALFGAGLSQSLSMISLVLLLVQTSERRLRGRVMGVRMLAIYSLPIGLVAAGWLIPRFGYPAVATGYAASGLVLTVVIWLVWRRCLWQVQPSA
ncbi:MAG TPA: arabinose ABC transporter permease, partial [Hyphomicrobiaceae bacterium]|nr:arabinose ABC transporter permease [Hyphomicrobiaceae bacterium]